LVGRLLVHRPGDARGELNRAGRIGQVDPDLLVRPHHRLRDDLRAEHRQIDDVDGRAVGDRLFDVLDEEAGGAPRFEAGSLHGHDALVLCGALFRQRLIERRHRPVAVVEYRLLQHDLRQGEAVDPVEEA
jgi:hypothetical protein